MTKKETQSKTSKTLNPAIKLAKEAKDKAVKGAKKLIDQIPKAVEKSTLLQNTLAMILEMKQQAKSVKKDANEEVHKILDVLHSSYGEFESKAKAAKTVAQKQAEDGLHQLVAQWDKKKSSLPKKFSAEMDKLLENVGLRKKASKAKSAPKKPEAAKQKPAAKKAAPKTAKKAAAKKTAAKPKKLVIKKVTPQTNM